MQTSDIIELMGERALAYRFLSRAFRTAPDAAFIAALREAAKDRPADDPLAEFFAELDSRDAAEDEALRIDLAAEYNRLFLGMGPHPVAPYESVYTSPEHLLMQEARDEVLTAYRSQGLDAPDDFDLPEDHLALECAFVAELADRTAEACAKGDGEAVGELVAFERAFVENHVASWVPAFCDDVEAHARTSFYRGLAALAREQVEADREVLAGL
ncbi:hypothetical protein B5F40_12025 [Gordonibacter sp. An230]|uniref:TorD/DmsD family molecular chaperone n=1 Tax=Gordonibacter sp. An230 TaxID=1965592 RepID=UPI000B3A6467|nr:molecular chaperone TorD family protein [Gordonibacter sp. An230]OUO88929.1 hypothetical protein B5F40_12025 [Gordonibacter sp. An230]